VSVNPSTSNIWYDVEDGCYVDESNLLPSLELGEPSCSLTRPVLGGQLSFYHHPRPSANKIDQHESDGITRPSLTEPTAYTVPKPADQDSGMWNDIAAAELEKEMDLSCADRDRLSMASLPFSPRSPRRSIELSPHLNTRQNQSDIAHRRSEERRDAS
jgi:hypothetical protein